MRTLLRLAYATDMGITLLLLFCEHLEYIHKREFALSNAALLVPDAAALALLAAAVILIRRKGSSFACLGPMPQRPCAS